MDHDAEVQRIVTSLNDAGYLKSRESNTVEFKQSFNLNSAVRYAKTMAAFANNRGGYIIFGVKDSPRKVVGIQGNRFENLNQENFTSALDTLFSPSLEWESGSFEIKYEEKTVRSDGIEGICIIKKCIAWIYTEEAERKPVVALKNDSGEKISSGDVFYRYRARSEKIKFAEMHRIIDERLTKEREQLMKLFDVIRKSDTANLGIVNYENGKISTPNGIDVAVDRKLVTQVLRKAKFIKEGSFNETDGIPVIKVTGNIDLAEEIPVPDLDPDTDYPYTQKDMAEKLGIAPYNVQVLIWHYKIKGTKKYHIEVTTSKSGKAHKFSDYALRFLEKRLGELKGNPDELNQIRRAYTNRNKQEVPQDGQA